GAPGARRHGAPRGAPFAPDQVDVGMAGAAVEDVGLHVARTGLATLDREGRQRRTGGLGGIGGDHGGGLAEGSMRMMPHPPPPQPASSTCPRPVASISATAVASAAGSVPPPTPMRNCTSPAGVRDEWIDSRLTPWRSNTCSSARSDPGRSWGRWTLA